MTQIINISVNQLIDLLSSEKYCLTANGREPKYDEQGNLTLIKTSSMERLTVPNIQAVRNIYNLPPTIDMAQGAIPNEAIVKVVKDYITESEFRILEEEPDQNQGDTGKTCYGGKEEDENTFVWIGQRTKRCLEASKALIDLYRSPKYSKLMNDRSTMKLKVWEKIAVELQEKGYKIADNVRDAGLRTFQKWRNMERTYWRYLKNPEDCGEYTRRKKPAFFDEMHAVLSKQNKYPSYNEGEDEGMGTQLLGKLPREIVRLLRSLANTPKYKTLLENNSPTKFEIWEDMYDEITSRGFDFAATKKEGAMMLCRKWREMENARLEDSALPRSQYAEGLCNSILAEYQELSSTVENGPLIIADVEPSTEVRVTKHGDIPLETVEALLRLIYDDKFQELFTGNVRKTRIWGTICDELEANGWYVPGETMREKCQKLFQKWRNLKRKFIDYHNQKIRGVCIRKPAFYDVVLRIISKEILRTQEHRANVLRRVEELNEAADEPIPTDFLHCTQLDHDYQGSQEHLDTPSNSSENLNTTASTVNPSSVEATTLHSASTSSGVPPLSKGNKSSGRSFAMLQKMLRFQEQALAVQQQNFTKVISLLQDQLKEQQTLNYLFVKYISNGPTKRQFESGKNNIEREVPPLKYFKESEKS